MVFFFTNMWPQDLTRGITKKVYAQMDAMSEIGHPVKYYTGYTNDGAAVFDQDGNVLYEKKIPGKFGIIKRVVRNYVLKIVAGDFLNEGVDDIDIVYIRYLFFDPFSIRLFRNAKKNNRQVILEMHSYPNYHVRGVKMYPVFVVDFLCRKFILPRVDKLVAISDRKTIWGRQAICIDNGIDLENAVIHERVHENKKIIRLISVSYEWYCHGYDRIIKGLAEYYKKEQVEYEVEVYFVGTVTKKTKNLIKKTNMEQHVKLLGPLYGDELNEAYNQCDIGLGIMAPHRVAHSASSGLKTKEYIAKGIPFVYAGKPLFDAESFKYGMSIESNEEPVCIDDIVEFYKLLLKEDNIQENMRMWARDYTWVKEMGKVFE
jgi:hypothetical protein